MEDFSTENNKDVDRNWTEKRERDKERDEEGVPEDESSSDVAPSATKRAKATLGKNAFLFFSIG